MFNTYTPLTVLPATVYKEVMKSEIRDRQPPLRTQDGIKTVIVIIIGRRVIQKMNVFNSEMPSRSWFDKGNSRTTHKIPTTEEIVSRVLLLGIDTRDHHKLTDIRDQKPAIDPAVQGAIRNPPKRSNSSYSKRNELAGSWRQRKNPRRQRFLFTSGTCNESSTIFF